MSTVFQPFELRRELLNGANHSADHGLPLSNLGERFGPDTDEFVRRLAMSARNEILNVSGLRLTHLPPLPPTLQEFYCSASTLTHLPPLPPTLQVLACPGTQIEELVNLPDSLMLLFCHNMPLRRISAFPRGLRSIYCQNTQLQSLPEFPPSLQNVRTENTPLVIQRREGEEFENYRARWNEWHTEEASRRRTQERCKAFKEDLMAECWNPRRVEKLLEGGWNF